MNLRLGIYEIFSRIVPGGLYIVAVAQFLSVFGIIKFDLQVFNNLSIAVLIGLIVAAYILGEAFDNLSLIFFRLFQKKGVSSRTFAQFKKTYQDRWQIDFSDNDWSLLLAFIRTKNLELAGELERYNAISIMLRNISLGLLFMVIGSLMQLFISHNWVNAYAAFLVLILSMLMIRESMRFRRWFYTRVYETTLAYRIDLETAITPVRPGDNRRKAEKKSHVFRKTTIPKEEQ